MLQWSHHQRNMQDNYPPRQERRFLLMTMANVQLFAYLVQALQHAPPSFPLRSGTSCVPKIQERHDKMLWWQIHSARALLFDAAIWDSFITLADVGRNSVGDILFVAISKFPSSTPLIVEVSANAMAICEASWPRFSYCTLEGDSKTVISSFQSKNGQVFGR